MPPESDPVLDDRAKIISVQKKYILFVVFKPFYFCWYLKAEMTTTRYKIHFIQCMLRVKLACKLT